MRVLLMAGALVLTSAPAFAQFVSNVGIPGRCVEFDVSGIKYQCKMALYTHFENGRIAIQFDTPKGSVMFSGGSDSQIDPRRYILNVDRIRVGRADGSSQPYAANGECVMLAKDDAFDFVHSISCRASNGTETVKVEFAGTGKAEHLKF